MTPRYIPLYAVRRAARWCNLTARMLRRHQTPEAVRVWLEGRREFGAARSYGIDAAVNMSHTAPSDTDAHL